MELVFFLAAVLIVGALLLAVITMTKGGGAKALDVNRYRSKWLSIEQQLSRDDASTHQLAVLNADKLLDQALKEKGVAGNTMGERMKATQWSNANAVWAAHKLRNKIAHEADVKVDYAAARQALVGFKQALKDLGAI